MRCDVVSIGSMRINRVVGMGLLLLPGMWDCSCNSSSSAPPPGDDASASMQDAPSGPADADQ
jgi:hypothetical protein